MTGMELFDYMLSNPNSHQSIVVSGGPCTGQIVYQEEEETFSEDEATTEYVEEYQLQELAKYEGAIENQARTCAMSMLSGVTDLEDTDYDKPENCTETLKKIYNNYVFLQPIRAELPIDAKKRDILSTLQITNVVVIQGETGCGKTTQVPQFILNDYNERKEYCNIVVTQPRKLAAISVAKHVCNERGWALGSIVGYQVGLDRVAGPDTLLTYMTAGVLLQKIILRKNLNEFTHVIIDEVHERSQEMDFLLILLRRFMNTNSLGVKVILMSATFNTTKFAEYFKKIVDGITIPAVCIDVNKSQTGFGRTIYYSEDLKTLAEVPEDFEFSEAHISKVTYNLFVKLILALSKVEEDTENIGHVLVFLPGIYEIEEAYKVLMRESNKGKGNFLIVPLHSSIPSHDQIKVFAKPLPGTRKIILSTNIAESSITVPDIEYVIDFCMTKTLEVHSSTQYQSLVLSWASKMNCIQRAGRVGRVCPGRVYRLVSRNFYEQLPDDIPPEMLRSSLERVVLFSKKLELAELPQSILALAMDPPNLCNIRATVKKLKEVGALLATCRGQMIEGDGDITMLGTLMWNLPIDVQLSKMIALGYMFSCLEECIIMAAGCSLSNIFSTPFRERLNAYGNKLLWADGSCSDLIAHLRLYETYHNNKKKGDFRSYREEKQWCAQHYLSHRSMREWTILVKEICRRLEAMNLRPTLGPQHVVLNDADKSVILKTVIAGAFYPNYFSRSSDAGQVDEREVCKALRGLEHRSTVYFRNMDNEQPGPLYEQRIREFFRDISDDFLIYFDGGRIYVNFNSKQMQRTIAIKGRPYVTKYLPGNIMPEVYKSVMMRILRMPISFPVMAKNLAWEMAMKLNLATDKDGYPALIRNPAPKKAVSVLPTLRESSMFVVLWHIIDAGHFYAQPATKECSERINAIISNLNSTSLDSVDKNTIELDGNYACKFTDDQFYRCRVLGMLPFGQHGMRINIIYIDYGNTATVSASDLYQLPTGVARLAPPQAMECVLCGVQPIATFNPHGTWPTKANLYMRDLTADMKLRAEIFSVVNDVVSVTLYRKEDSTSINQMIIDAKYGERHEEEYLSKENNQQRYIAQSSMSNLKGDEVQLEPPLSASIAKNVEAPGMDLCRREIHLRGPYSPLEMQVYPMTHSVGVVRIEQSSINTVLLDHEPQDPHERLIVAASISKSQYGEVLTLRNTTMMPCSRGLPAIMSMLFAPQVQIKASADGTAYASALCGLGVDSRNKAIYPEQDLQAFFDVEFSQQDLIGINEMRYIMNRLINIMQQYSNRTNVQPHQFHRQLKDRLLKLLSEQRESKDREHVPYADSWTKHAYNGIDTRPDSCYNKVDDIWPLHGAVELRDKNDENVRMEIHFKELRDYLRGYKPMPPSLLCQFCNVKVVCESGLRAHILTNQHIDLTQAIRRRME